MAAHRHWRMSFAYSNGGTYLELTEMAFIAGGGVDLSVGGVSSATTTYGSGYESSKAFDKNNTTDWCSLGGVWPTALQYDHGAPVEPVAVKIRWSASSAWLPRTLGDMSAEWSDDGISWFGGLVLSVTSGSISPNTDMELGIVDMASVTARKQGGTIVAAGSPLPAFSGAKLQGGSFVWADIYNGGMGRVKGTVKDKGTPNVPVSERVRLYRMRDGIMIREQWSARGTGAYSFDGIDPNEIYYVISFDQDLAFRAVIADNLTLAGGGVELIA